MKASQEYSRRSSSLAMVNGFSFRIVRTKSACSPLSKLEQQVRDQQHQVQEQQATIAELRVRLARLEALLKPAVSRK